MISAKELNKAGIYKLTCLKNNKIYIGKSTNLYKRLNNHKNCGSRKAIRFYLQKAIVKHGWDSFVVDILETFEDFDANNEEHKRLILEREAYYIELFNSTDNSVGYNFCKFSTDKTGSKLSEEHKEKIRNANTGRVFSEEHREKIRINQTGRKMSEESRLKMSLYRTGRPISEEARQKRIGRKISEESRLKRIGRKLSEETKRKMSVASSKRKHTEESKEKIRNSKLGKKLSRQHIESIKQGRKNYRHSEETKLKISLASSNRKHTEETKEKLRVASSNRKHTEETKKKISETKLRKKLELLVSDDELSLLEKLSG